MQPLPIKMHGEHRLCDGLDPCTILLLISALAWGLYRDHGASASEHLCLPRSYTSREVAARNARVSQFLLHTLLRGQM